MSEAVQIAIIGAGSGFVGVIVGAGISWAQTAWFQYRQNEKNAIYLAIRVVCIFEKYLEGCAKVIQDDGCYHGQENPNGEVTPQVSDVKPPVFPEDVDWRTIDSSLMYRILSFPAKVENALDNIAWNWDEGCSYDREEFFRARDKWHSQLGLEANEIVEKLCKKYRISRNTYEGWNPVSVLKDKQKALKRQKTPSEAL